MATAVGNALGQPCPAQTSIIGLWCSTFPPTRATRHNLPALYVFTVQLGPEYKHIHTLKSQYPFWVFSHAGPVLPPCMGGAEVHPSL